ncbi:YcaO-like protein with predicted kinase domain [Kitasatospora sp. MAA4]|uniref:YcaO-like family protein n=1 Tax=Kitasatospora sp. MAA4 TaxID=3035093 RepID=UPI00247643C6|nr:YcaO-like family protein [Kitasatospora sp. MAA4]MDH6130646.1 YcaO-like protein with predicted kinase domain [Kitasatospora sp. MAA4]
MTTTARQAALDSLVPAAEAILADADPRCDHGRYAATGRHRSLEDSIQDAWNLRAVSGVSRVADITGLDRLGIPVFNTYRTTAAPGNLTVTCGKGRTRKAALASALMEAHERYCGEQQGRQGPVLTVARARERFAEVLDPRELVLDTRTGWEPDAPLEWIPTRDLVSGAVVQVPADAVFSPYQAHGARLFANHSDGLASGNCLAEATLHALYELVERDGRSFGEVLRLGHQVDLDSLPPDLRRLARTFEEAGISLSLFAFRSSLEITSFFALGDDRLAENPMLVNAGAGCHLNPLVGVSRALTELAQSRLSVISGAREDFSTRYRDRREETYQAAHERAARWSHGWQRISFDEIPDHSAGDLGTDLETVCRSLRGAGLPRILVADLTLADPAGPRSRGSVDDALPRVVKVIVPGLEFAANEPSRVGSRFYRFYKQARGAR